VFAEKGFRAASLYAAVFRYARKCCEAQYPIDAAAGASPRERLHAYVRSIMLRLLDRGRPAWHWQLMTREMMSPTRALDEMVENSIKPEFEMIGRVIGDLTGLSWGDPRIGLCINSVIGQALFYRHAQAVVQRLDPRQKFERQDIEDLADHITEFSLGAFEAIARKPSPRNNGKHRSAKRERSA
jgi:hypothetical protein